MKLLYSKEGKVDLENPIYLEEDQLDKFSKFLGSLMNEKIQLQNVKEKERHINPDSSRHPKKWTEKEYILLLNSNLSDQELVKRLGRSQMSIGMQKAQFIPEFVSWAKSKGFDASKISLTIIKQFLEEDNDSA